MAFDSYGNRFQRNTPVVLNLIIINVLVYLAQRIIGDSVTDKIALYPINSEFFKPYQVVTHMFAHSPTMLVHIIFNMFALWMFGTILERSWGPKRFLIFYLVSGLAAAGLHLLMQYLKNPEAGHITQVMYDQAVASEGYFPTYYLGGAVGASGAIMGVLAAFAYLFPNTPLYMMFIPIPIKAKFAIPVMVAIDLFGGFAGIQGDSIAHFAHLGGAIAGFLMVLYWNKMNKNTFY
ncbi:MAG: rhomboid family intramembrane serine protease [Ferruginibacter sp.]